MMLQTPVLVVSEFLKKKDIHRDTLGQYIFKLVGKNLWLWGWLPEGSALHGGKPVPAKPTLRMDCGDGARVALAEYRS